MTKTPSRQPRGVCAACQKEVATYVPAGGDGSLRWPRKHRSNGRFGPICEGSYMQALPLRLPTRG